jgi:hypothetical protein
MQLDGQGEVRLWCQPMETCGPPQPAPAILKRQHDLGWVALCRGGCSRLSSTPRSWGNKSFIKGEWGSPTVSSTPWAGVPSDVSQDSSVFPLIKPQPGSDGRHWSRLADSWPSLNDFYLPASLSQQSTIQKSILEKCCLN